MARVKFVENENVTKTIINEEFVIIPNSSKVVQIYISNEFTIETFAFRVDLTDFEEEDRESFDLMINKLKNINHPHLLEILGVFDDNNEKNGRIYRTIHCEVPYCKTVENYNIQNQCMELEFKKHISDLVEIYKLVKELNFEVDVTLHNLSIVMKKSDLPFPKLHITPYAFIMGFINKVEQKEVFIHKSFASLFQFFNDKVGELSLNKNILPNFIGRWFNWQEKPIAEIVQILNEDKDATEAIEKNEYIKKIADDLVIPTFSLDDLTLDKALGKGTFGSVCLVHNTKGTKYALKQSPQRTIDELHRESFVLHKLHNPNHHPNLIEMKGYCVSMSHVVEDWIDVPEDREKIKERYGVRE